MINRRSFVSACAASSIAVACTSTMRPSHSSAQTPGPIEPAVDFAPTLFELRQYTLEPGERDRFLAIFEASLLDAYQRNGTRVLGSFRHLDDPNRWVWFRTFPDAASRGPAVGRFYQSEDWKQHATAINSRIAGIEPAMLLTWATAPQALPQAPVTGQVEPPPLTAIYEITVYPLRATSEATFHDEFNRVALPVLAEAGMTPMIQFISDHRENSFPKQPVRATSVYVTLTRFASTAQLHASQQALAAHPRERTGIAVLLAQHLTGAPEVIRLTPTTRSAMR